MQTNKISRTFHNGCWSFHSLSDLSFSQIKSFFDRKKNSFEQKVVYISISSTNLSTLWRLLCEILTYKIQIFCFSSRPLLCLFLFCLPFFEASVVIKTAERSVGLPHRTKLMPFLLFSFLHTKLSMCFDLLCFYKQSFSRSGCLRDVEIVNERKILLSCVLRFMWDFFMWVSGDDWVG